MGSYRDRKEDGGRKREESLNVISCLYATNADSKEQRRDTGAITVPSSVAPYALLNILRKIWRDEYANRFGNKCDQ